MGCTASGVQECSQNTFGESSYCQAIKESGGTNVDVPCCIDHTDVKLSDTNGTLNVSIPIETIISTFKLQPHPEGGWYSETFRSTDIVDTSNGKRSASTAIYFLLTKDNVSRFHKIQSDEVVKRITLKYNPYLLYGRYGIIILVIL